MEAKINHLPSIMEYSQNLDKVIKILNIGRNEARNKFGKFTVKQWNELLTKNN